MLVIIREARGKRFVHRPTLDLKVGAWQAACMIADAGLRSDAEKVPKPDESMWQMTFNSLGAMLPQINSDGERSEREVAPYTTEFRDGDDTLLKVEVSESDSGEWDCRITLCGVLVMTSRTEFDQCTSGAFQALAPWISDKLAELELRAEAEGVTEILEVIDEPVQLEPVNFMIG